MELEDELRELSIDNMEIERNNNIELKYLNKFNIKDFDKNSFIIVYGLVHTKTKLNFIKNYIENNDFYNCSYIPAFETFDLKYYDTDYKLYLQNYFNRINLFTSPKSEYIWNIILKNNFMQDKRTLCFLEYYDIVGMNKVFNNAILLQFLFKKLDLYNCSILYMSDSYKFNRYDNGKTYDDYIVICKEFNNYKINNPILNHCNNIYQNSNLKNTGISYDNFTKLLNKLKYDEYLIIDNTNNKMNITNIYEKIYLLKL